MSAHAALRADLQRTWEQLDNLPPRTVVIDENGDAWQSGGSGYWYRAFDSEGISAFQMAQRARKVSTADVELYGEPEPTAEPEQLEVPLFDLEEAGA